MSPKPNFLQYPLMPKVVKVPKSRETRNRLVDMSKKIENSASFRCSSEGEEVSHTSSCCKVTHKCTVIVRAYFFVMCKCTICRRTCALSLKLGTYGMYVRWHIRISVDSRQSFTALTKIVQKPI